MYSMRSPLAQWGAALLSQASHRPQALPRVCLACQSRLASGGANQKNKRKNTSAAATKKKKRERKDFKQQDLKDADKFSLLDAMRYIRAFEVGRPPNSPKYELAVRLRTPKDGPVIRNRLNLPHPVKTDLRICVICPPDSPAAAAAVAAGATLVGEDTVFDAVKEGRVEFDRCIAHEDSAAKLGKSGVARTLGPRGLMPSAKTGTVVRDVGAAVRDMVGASEYRERAGVLRLAIGTLGASPLELRANIRTFIDKVKADIGVLGDRVTKEVHEVVLSSTNAPGFTLSGDFAVEGGTTAEELVN